jgi:nucleoside-diphosphate-sugar epimerase
VKVLVTGGAGKLGSWVVGELCSSEAPHHVVVLDRITPACPVEGPHYLLGDIRELGQVVEAASGMDAIIHLAAVPRPGLTSDAELFATNVLGTFNVHQAASILGIAKVVSTSSSAVYGWSYRVRDVAASTLPLREGSPTNPQDAYGLSKLVGESIARSFVDATGASALVLRPPWIIDPTEARRLKQNGGRPPTFGDLMAYVDVRDLAGAYRLCLESRLDGFRVFNVNAPDSTVIGKAWEFLADVDPQLSEAAQDLPSNDALIDAGPARDLLEWTTRHSWRDASAGD